MTESIKIAETFGAFASNGEQANVFRFATIEPLLNQGVPFVMDFEGVTNMTSSFANGLIATLVAHSPEKFSELVRFKECSPAVKQMVIGALETGRREARELA